MFFTSITPQNAMRLSPEDAPTHDPRIGFFDRLAENWDTSEQSPEKMVEELTRRSASLGLRPGDHLLEIGCGTGQITGWLTEQVRPGRVTAVDFSPEMLRRAEAKQIDASFRRADACRDELGRSEFDVALCFHSFPHFRDQPTALRNIARCLKPGGRLIVMHLSSRDHINAFHGRVGGDVGGDLLPEDHHWRAWLATAGFEPPEIADGDDGFLLQAVRVV